MWGLDTKISSRVVPIWSFFDNDFEKYGALSQTIKAVISKHAY